MQNKLQLPEYKFTTINGLKTAYRQMGEGPQLFLLPPWPSGSTSFLLLMNELSQHYNMWVVDLPGWMGASEKNIDCDNLVKTYTDFIGEFINRFKKNDYFILGYSFGGFFLQKLMEQNKLDAKHYFLASTFISGADLFFNKQRLWGLELYRLLADSKYRTILASSVLKKSVQAVFELIKHYKRKDIVKMLVQEIEEMNPHCPFDLLVQSQNESVDIPAKEYKHNTILIKGEKDAPYVIKGMINLSQKLGIEPVEIPGAYHDGVITHAPELALVLKSYGKGS